MFRPTQGRKPYANKHKFKLNGDTPWPGWGPGGVVQRTDRCAAVVSRVGYYLCNTIMTMGSINYS